MECSMERRLLLASVLASAALLPRRIAAEAPAKSARLGWLTAQRPASLAPYVEAFRAGLADFGYQEGRDLVIVFSGDPVSAGLADSLARPRGNMTGLTFMAAEINGKRL